MFLEQEQQEHKFRFKNTNSEIKKKKKKVAVENSSTIIKSQVNAKTLPISKANLDWRCSEDKLDEEILALDRLDLDDLEVLRERRLQ